ncbi:MAG: hypothetical protein IAE86_04190 [Burkholderiaceae bacterium]|nr:hypothetical protein [Burkholderiaceae bacterium]
MNGPTTAREALLAELIGDVAQLIKRMETLTPLMDESRQALAHSSVQLSSQVAAFEIRMAAITENAKIQAVRHITHRTEELAQRTREEQTRAMAESARDLFRTELTPALQRLAMPLQHLVDRLAHPWQSWLTHAATAAVAAAATWLLALYGGFG